MSMEAKMMGRLTLKNGVYDRMEVLLNADRREALNLEICLVAL